ncbi:MAG: hypothetical protein FK733_11520 [Asgard group archaeon]|nr:hypothetical protein [Asgard group archaeon]
MQEEKSWLDYKNKNLLTFFYKPFIIYGKQFLKFFIFSLIIEFIFFGIFQIIVFDANIEYIPILNRVIIRVGVDFISDSGRAFFFILLFFSVSFFIIRSTIISNTSWLTFEKGKANFAIVLENTFKKTKEIILFTLLFAVIMFFPILLIVLAIIMMVRDYYLAWAMIIFAVVVPFIIGIKLSLYNAGMAKDSLHVGTALQTSWTLTKRRNWMKVCLIFTFYGFLAIAGPWALTAYFNQIYDYTYLGIIMVFVRALLYPLFDIAMTHMYLNFDATALSEAVFRDEIIEQRKRSEEFRAKFRKNNQKESV